MMSDTIAVRDHSKPCEHLNANEARRLVGDEPADFPGEAFLSVLGQWLCTNKRCPGGQGVTLRRWWGPDVPEGDVFWMEVTNE